MKGEVVDTAESTALAIPGTGEVLDLANPDDAALAYNRLAVLAEQVRDAQTHVRRALVAHAGDYGGNTMILDSAEVKVTTGDSISWDLTELEKLKEFGLPTARWEQLVKTTTTVERKVSATVAKQIAKAKPEYAAIIERACTRTPKPPSVSVSLRV